MKQIPRAKDNYILLFERKSSLHETSGNISVSATVASSPALMVVPQDSEIVSASTSGQTSSIGEDLTFMSVFANQNNQVSVQESSCSSILTPNINEVPQRTAANKPRKQVSLDELEALIKLLEVKDNKTLSEKEELKKLKRKRVNLKNYKKRRRKLSRKR